MRLSEDIVARITAEVMAELRGELEPIPIGVSVRHVHLTRQHLDVLYGPGYELTVRNELYQPGFYAANECVTVATPKRALHNVRILFPLRDHSQVELARTDAFALGVDPPLRISGDVAGTPGVTLVGPAGSVQLDQGMIIAARHVHMDQATADRFGVKGGQAIKVAIDGPRGVVLDHVVVRISEGTLLEMHLDTDEANAADVAEGVVARMVR